MPMTDVSGVAFDSLCQERVSHTKVDAIRKIYKLCSVKWQMTFISFKV